MNKVISELREEVDFYKQLLLEIVSFVSDGVILFKPEGDIVECNSASCEMFGFNRVEMLASNIYNFSEIKIKDSYVKDEVPVYEMHVLKKCNNTRFKSKDGESFFANFLVFAYKSKKETVLALLVNGKKKFLTNAFSDFSEHINKVEAMRNITGPLVMMMGAFDPYTARHSIKVSHLMQDIGLVLERSGEELDLLGVTGRLHDIGKSAIPVGILSKPGTLSNQEMSLIRTHPSKGHQILMDGGFYCGRVAGYVLHHHEKYDGSGYPHGLAGDDIELVSQIISVADTFEAMTSRRPYHDPRNEKDVLDHIKKEKGISFSPLIVDAFFESRNMVTTSS